MTIKELYQEWYEDRQANVKPSSIARYDEIYRRHIINAPIADIDIENMKHSDMQKFSNSVFSSGLARGTCKQVLIVAKSIITYYYIANDLPIKVFKLRYPTVNATEVSERKVYSFREKAVLTDYILKHLNKGRTNKANMYLGTAIAMFTGLRVGEVCGLRWKDIDLDGGKLSVRQTVYRINGRDGSHVSVGSPKTICSARTIPIADDLRRLMQRFRRDDGDIYVTSDTTTPSEPSSMRRSFQRLCGHAGVSSVKFHSLRHGFATDLLLNNVDVKTTSTLMGHHNAATTMNIYAHTNDISRFIAVNVGTRGLLANN